MTGLLGAGLILLGVSRPWGTVQVVNLASFGDLEISGATAAPAGTAVALAVAAASLVLTIAGRVVRFLIPFGVLVAGAALAYSGVATLSKPDEAAGNAVRDTLSLGGGDFVDGFTFTTSLNGWGWIYVAGALVIVLAGLLGVLGSRSWPVGGKRFEREATKSPIEDEGRPAVGGWSSSADVWDAQNRGEDLTSDPAPNGSDRS
nr:Trp biosynthesis-associated membrane protein [Kineosporia rhizophila]